MTAPLLEVQDLVVHYPGGGLFRRGAPVCAVNGVSFSVARGETLALVGESGSGKSSLARTILRLQAKQGGTVRFGGTDLFALRGRALRAERRRLQIVFQDPASSLNPRMRIGDAVAEGLAIHALAPRAEWPARVAALLGEVGLDPALAARWPHELSGGQKQRVAIARALAVEPALVVLDEAVSALDVSVQAQVLTLLTTLQQRRGLAYLFIAHDLAVVAQVAHRVAVLYAGRVVEEGPVGSILTAPRHPYTQALLAAVPAPDPSAPPPRLLLQGDPPDPSALPPGCPLWPRCPHPARDAHCQAERPALRPVGPTHAACHHAGPAA
ncbi:MAG: ATP-binding cassette domain-containing protein [Gemmatimonadetes bacterium]|nr:ATP-binding cassette domain-containing protein [Gemmatimonadota bacterium]